jgi:hypothetical protein
MSDSERLREPARRVLGVPPLTKANQQIDHIVPFAAGGPSA